MQRQTGKSKSLEKKNNNNKVKDKKFWKKPNESFSWFIPISLTDLTSLSLCLLSTVKFRYLISGLLSFLPICPRALLWIPYRPLYPLFLLFLNSKPTLSGINKVRNIKKSTRFKPFEADRSGQSTRFLHLYSSNSSSVMEVSFFFFCFLVFYFSKLSLNNWVWWVWIVSRITVRGVVCRRLGAGIGTTTCRLRSALSQQGKPGCFVTVTLKSVICTWLVICMRMMSSHPPWSSFPAEG